MKKNQTFKQYFDCTVQGSDECPPFRNTKKVEQNTITFFFFATKGDVLKSPKTGTCMTSSDRSFPAPNCPRSPGFGTLFGNYHGIPPQKLQPGNLRKAESWLGKGGGGSSTWVPWIDSSMVVSGSPKAYPQVIIHFMGDWPHSNFREIVQPKPPQWTIEKSRGFFHQFRKNNLPQKSHQLLWVIFHLIMWICTSLTAFHWQLMVGR